MKILHESDVEPFIEDWSAEQEKKPSSNGSGYSCSNRWKTRQVLSKMVAQKNNSSSSASSYGHITAEEIPIILLNQT